MQEEEDADLAAFAAAWAADPDGVTGRRYAEALTEAGRIDEAAAVCRRMWDLGYPAGYTDLARLEHDRGDTVLAVRLLTEAIPDLDDDDLPLAHGVLGGWLWELNDPTAEAHLRAGVAAVPGARVDLAALLRTTGRREEGRRVLEEGVAADEAESMLPLANLLDEAGDTARAERLYRRAFELGDAYSAWNLGLLLLRLGRVEEAEEWRWRAAQGGDELAIASLAQLRGPGWEALG